MIYKNIENKKLRFEINRFSRILILTGQNSFFKTGANNILNIINNKIETKIIFKRSFVPQLSELKKIYNKLTKFKPDLVIALGGGTIMDYSKVLSIMDDVKNIKLKIEKNKFKFKKKNFTLICIPTIAGSGAEETANAVMYVGKKKYSIENDLVKPDKNYLVSSLVLKNPKKIKASSGFDAISQAIESILSIRSNEESIKFAKKSLIISKEYYLKYLNRPNIFNSSKMLLASNLSGKAISISKTIAPHAVSYPFTSYFGISHGHAVSLTLKDFLKFNFLNIKFAKKNFNLEKRFKLLFNVFDVRNISELINLIGYIQEQASLENKFYKLGINIKKDINKILTNINEQRLSNNPINITVNDVKSIILDK